jgi:hypothetical protein
MNIPSSSNRKPLNVGDRVRVFDAAPTRDGAVWGTSLEGVVEKKMIAGTMLKVRILESNTIAIVCFNRVVHA